jgi:hypothetical protein
LTGGEWNTSRERKSLQREQREQEREQLRLEKRHLRDLRWAIERSTVESSDWQDLLSLQAAHGREGPIQLWRELIPYWRQCQRINGGADMPPELSPQAAGIFPRDSPAAPANRQKPGKGATRKVRSDAGITKPRKLSAP